MTTSPVLVTIFRWEKHVFGDETRFRRHFWLKKACFWRRDLFSSPFFGGKSMFLATRSVLVTIFR
ncbi:hypothetical protein NSQ82_02820 [Caldifermentibacillus hisashii]|uniref:hypothetical protein n=1 Tax=Caldifermentibacillus hisashii TaxID=996558 RepID=UPI0031B701B6